MDCKSCGGMDSEDNVQPSSQVEEAKFTYRLIQSQNRSCQSNK